MLKKLEKSLANAETECLAGAGDYTAYYDGPHQLTFINASVDLELGFCSFSQTIRIIHIAVAVEQRGDKIGTRVVQEICTFADKHDLGVYAENVLEEAERFWRKHAGFLRDSDNPDGFFYPATGYQALA